MRIYAVLIISTVLFFGSCAVNKTQTTRNTILKRDQTISIHDITREYHIQYPKDSKSKPLVILLHGHGGSANQSIGKGIGNAPQKVWLDLAHEQEFIVVVPNGEKGPEGKRGWNDCRADASGNPSTDDVLFINSLIEKIALNYEHDTKRVYVAGVSNGASMAKNKYRSHF